MQAGPRIGTALLLGITCLSGLAAWGAQQWRPQRNVLTPDQSPAQLWQAYRWSIDPQQRREAALLMVADGGSADLLRGQGWGQNPLAAVALELSAEAAQPAQASGLWRELLQRFPNSPSSAWARLALAEQQSDLSQQLLEQQPGHPAALTLATTMEPSASQGHRGALHLAQWGVRGPGALQRLRAACNDTTPTAPNQQQRQVLAAALARLGDATAAQRCLNAGPTTAETQLAIGRSLLAAGSEAQGTALLIKLAQDQPKHPASQEAARLLSEPLVPDPAVLDALPSTLQTQSAAVAAARVRLANGDNASTVLQRWPNDPDVWQLQWDLARAALLKQQWNEAQQLLERDAKLGPLPGPLEARRLFWLGFSLEQQGEQAAAHQLWERFIHSTPPGYYRWRAMERLKQTPPLDLRQPLSTPTPDAWRPLNSDSALANTLWRLGLTAQAWDAWRSAQAPNPTTSYPEQLVEGRLRLALGDTWKGLDQIWRLSLRWRSPDCTELEQVHRSQLPRLFTKEMSKAADGQQLRQELLLAISKQESRFSPGVTSPVGAIGLMQLMPATANELAGTTLTEQMLREPQRNINLGARYLDQLLALWEGDPFRSIASYNAGPGAVSSWPDPNSEIDPALWVERIPYPETRYYTKKVLDNLIRYSERNHNFCEPTSGGIGKQVTQANTTEHQNGQRQH